MTEAIGPKPVPWLGKGGPEPFSSAAAPLLPLLADDPATLVRKIQEDVKRVLDELRFTRRFDPGVSITDAEWRRDGMIVPLPSGDEGQRFRQGVFAVLTLVAARLRVCENATCCRLFLGYGRQSYHSKRCSQYVRTMNFRDRHPEKVRERKHAAHTKRQQAKYPGYRVKVARRPRRDTPQE